jgi:hypothetical protein
MKSTLLKLKNITDIILPHAQKLVQPTYEDVHFQVLPP